MQSAIDKQEEKLNIDGSTPQDIDKQSVDSRGIGGQSPDTQEPCTNSVTTQNIRRKNSLKVKRLATAAVLSALAIIFGYIEFLVPISLGAPGIKLGLANIVTVVALYKLGWKYALPVSLVRVLISALLFGSMFSALYSLSGAMLSFAVMALLKASDKFSIAGVSMAGGVAHNIGQLAVACFAMQTSDVLYYYPVLLIAGLGTGIGIGIIATLVLGKLK